MASPSLERVAEFVAAQACVPRHEVSPHTRLAEDLGLAGDDGRNRSAPGPQASS